MEDIYNKHWNRIKELIETAFTEEFLFVKNHTERMHREGHLMLPQDDQMTLEVTKDNLIYAIEDLAANKLAELEKQIC